MRIALSIMFMVLIAGLGVCTFFAHKSKKPIGKTLALFISSLIPPVWGNLFIIASDVETLSLIGCYIYFLGMNYVMFALTLFTFRYCGLSKKLNFIKIVVYVLLVLDSIQILINPATGHAFGIEALTKYDSLFYQFTARWGLTIHRAIDYSILGGVLIGFVVKSIRAPKFSTEKYLVILFAMLAVAAWQTVYIFFDNGINYSMIGFGIFGVLVFLLTLYYRPLRLLDRMLSTIASKMSESIFFFDTNGKCIWANDKALELLNVTNDNLENVPELLISKIGEHSKEEIEWKDVYTTGSGDNVVSYAIEQRAVVDDRNHTVGTYLTIRDNTAEEKNLQRETFNAHHDALTKVLNRAGYDDVMDRIDLSKCFLILADLDSFKEVNDTNGHVIGDKVLVKVTETMSKYFRDEDCVCRIGGDEFAIVLINANKDTVPAVQAKVVSINEELNAKGDLPTISISAGGAFGKDAENAYELFNNADHALYETKFKGKKGFTLFKKR